MGGGRQDRQGHVPQSGRRGPAGDRRRRAVRRRRGARLPLQRHPQRGSPRVGRGQLGAVHDAAQRHLPAVLHEPLQRRAGRALDGWPRQRRADERHRHDRAGDRLRSGLDHHHGGAVGRRLRGERRQDVHHQRHQLRPGDRGGQDRPHREAPGHVADRAGGRHGGLRAGPQPRQAGLEVPGHCRAVLRRRVRARGEPARRRGQRVPAPRAQPAPGAPVDRGGRRGARAGCVRLDGGLRRRAHGVRPDHRLVPEHPLRAGRDEDRAGHRLGVRGPAD